MFLTYVRSVVNISLTILYRRVTGMPRLEEESDDDNSATSEPPEGATSLPVGLVAGGFGGGRFVEVSKWGRSAFCGVFCLSSFSTWSSMLDLTSNLECRMRPRFPLNLPQQPSFSFLFDGVIRSYGISNMLIFLFRTNQTANRNSKICSSVN